MSLQVSRNIIFHTNYTECGICAVTVRDQMRAYFNRNWRFSVERPRRDKAYWWLCTLLRRTLIVLCKILYNVVSWSATRERNPKESMLDPGGWFTLLVPRTVFIATAHYVVFRFSVLQHRQFLQKPLFLESKSRQRYWQPDLFRCLLLLSFSWCVLSQDGLVHLSPLPHWAPYPHLHPPPKSKNGLKLSSSWFLHSEFHLLNSQTRAFAKVLVPTISRTLSGTREMGQ